MTRGYATIYLKNGQTLSYNLVEEKDGYYFMGKRVASLRNWMLAERKAKELFREKAKQIVKQGKYKDSYSSMWSEGESAYISGTHTATFKRKPNTITALKRYGTNQYNLGFQTYRNFEYINGEWRYDMTYYAIQWKPTKPVTIFIEKSIYKKNGSHSEQKLSKIVKVTNKKEIDELIKKFKILHNKLKMLI